eukprot:scaffold17741_cov26-Tisochrysis_lutea.AAC.1
MAQPVATSAVPCVSHPAQPASYRAQGFCSTPTAPQQCSSTATTNNNNNNNTCRSTDDSHRVSCSAGAACYQGEQGAVPAHQHQQNQQQQRQSVPLDQGKQGELPESPAPGARDTAGGVDNAAGGRGSSNTAPEHSGAHDQAANACPPQTPVTTVA